MHRIPPVSYLRSSTDTVRGMFSLSQVSLVGVTVVSRRAGRGVASVSSSWRDWPGAAGGPASRWWRGLRHLCNKNSGLEQWHKHRWTCYLDCPWWSTSQWTRGRSRPQAQSSAGSGGSPRSPSSSRTSTRGHDLTCSRCRGCCTASEAAAWIASSCQSQNWGGWWASGAWCPQFRVFSGTPHWAASAESAVSVRTRHPETRSLHHLKLYRIQISKVFKSEEVQPEAITRCTTDEWKILKIDWQIPFISALLMGQWLLSTDLSLLYWGWTEASWPRDPDPASGPSDLRCLLSPDHSVYSFSKFLDGFWYYLRLTRHGHCTAFANSLRGKAVDREGQGGASASPADECQVNLNLCEILFLPKTIWFLCESIVLTANSLLSLCFPFLDKIK